jgi:hypothetical protein
MSVMLYSTKKNRPIGINLSTSPILDWLTQNESESNFVWSRNKLTISRNSVFHESVTFGKRNGTKRNKMTRKKSTKMCHSYRKVDLKFSQGETSRSFFFRTKLCSFLLRKTRQNSECFFVQQNRQNSDETAVSFVFFRILRNNFLAKIGNPKLLL